MGTGSKHSYPFRVLLSADQFGNAIAGGNPDCTISGRVGLYSMRGNIFWVVLRSIINFTFFPVDGYGHCQKAYNNERDEDYRRGSDIGLIALALISVTFCIPICTILYLLKFPTVVLRLQGTI